MNAIVSHSTRQALAIPEDQAIEVLRNSLYPGAKEESVRLVLAWCRATGRDPMKKPIHIVPMWVKDAVTKQGEMRDVLMPGIGTYRTDAANSGEYAGKTEPEFGPDITGKVGGATMTYPAWCKVTVFRIVAGKERPFPAKEFWTENYATKGKDDESPNTMWRKRPYAQLAKCAEAQALRMAFPDETGNTNTAEEMEGKTFDGVTIDVQPEAARIAQPRQAGGQQEKPYDLNGDGIPDWDAPPVDVAELYATRRVTDFAACKTIEQYNDILGNPAFSKNMINMRDKRSDLHGRVDASRAEALARLTAEAAPEAAS